MLYRIVIVTLLCQVYSQAQPRDLWWRAYDSGFQEADLFRKINRTSDGGMICCGISTMEDGDRGVQTQGWLLKMDRRGEVEWSIEIDETISPEPMFYVVEADNGDFVAVGDIVAQNRDIYAIRCDQAGELIWYNTFDYGRTDRARAVIEIKAGDFFLIAGSTNSFGPDYENGLLLMIDGEGDEVWHRAYGTDDTENFIALRETEGGYVMAGTVGRNQFQRRPGDAWIMKVNEEGDSLWSQRVGADNRDEEIFSFTSTGEGGFYLCGTDYLSPQGGNIFLARVDAEGRAEWMRYYASGIEGVSANGWDVRAFPNDGGCLVAAGGMARYPSGMVLRLEPGGDIAWRRAIPLPDDSTGTEIVFTSAMILPRGDLLLAGSIKQPEVRDDYDGLVMQFAPEHSAPEIVDFTPGALDTVVLIGTEIEFRVSAVDLQDDPLSFMWSLNREAINEDDSHIVIPFPVIGRYLVKCEVSDGALSDSIVWHVHVRDLLITSYLPESSSFTIQRNSVIDFALDSVAYIGDLENLRYEWMIYDSTAVRWEEVGGDDRIGIRSYAFDRTGGYALKAKVFDPNVDPVPADSVQWAIQVRGVIRAFEPNTPEISLEPRQEATFELIPFNANNDSIEFWWTLNEADTMSIESTLSISFQDTGRYVVSGYARERVGEEEWEEDVQRWAVNVRMLNAEFGMRNEGDLEIEDISLQIAPNPFNDQATVTISLGGRAVLPALRADKNVRPPRVQMGGLMPVRLSLYAIDGREVLRLHDGPLSSGTHQFRFFTSFRMTSGGGVTSGGGMPSGVYLLRLQAGSHSRTVKAVLLR